MTQVEGVRQGIDRPPLESDSPIALKLRIEERVPPELSEREQWRSTRVEE